MEKIIEKILEDLKVELAEKFDSNFSRGGFFGDRWKPKKDGSASRLIKSGALRRSIKSKIEGDTIVFTSSKPYAAAHNEGVDKIVTVRSKKGKTFQRRMKLPKRKFIGKYTGMEKTVERIAKKAIEEALKQIADNFNKS
jgi:phage gpG-like protein